MVSVSRIFLLCSTMRYVGDYGSTNITPHADSGLTTFEDFNGAPGIQHEGEQTPATGSITQDTGHHHINGIQPPRTHALPTCAAHTQGHTAVPTHQPPGARNTPGGWLGNAISSRADYTPHECLLHAIIFPPGDTSRAWCFQGRLPTEILKQFSPNTAFIYLLEAWVAIIARLICEPLLGKFYVPCCDNEAARHVLIKGVGKHQPLNCVISAHWTWHNRTGIAHQIERVPTKAKISDPVSRFETLPHGLLWFKIEIPHEAITARCFKIIGDIQTASSLCFDKVLLPS